MEFGIMILIACGLIAGNIYRNKGKKFWVGFLAGFFFGIFGILLTVVTGKDAAGKAKQDRKDEDKLIIAGTHKRCEYCAEVINSKAKLCSHCGKSQEI